MTFQGWWQQPNRLTTDLSHREPSVTRGNHKTKGVWPRGASARKHNQGQGNPNMEHHIIATTRTQYHVISVPRR